MLPFGSKASDALATTTTRNYLRREIHTAIRNASDRANHVQRVERYLASYQIPIPQHLVSHFPTSWSMIGFHPPRDYCRVGLYFYQSSNYCLQYKVLYRCNHRVIVFLFFQFVTTSIVLSKELLLEITQ